MRVQVGVANGEIDDTTLIPRIVCEFEPKETFLRRSLPKWFEYEFGCVYVVHKLSAHMSLCNTQS